MKTEYKHITFSKRAKVNQRSKTDTFGIYSNSTHELLGVVRWHWPWRQYCFYPDGETIWNRGCLEDVQDFIRQLMDDRKVDKGEEE